MQQTTPREIGKRLSDADALRAEAGLPGGEQSRARADAAFAESLLFLVQRYLADVSDQWDVDLFFETYGRPPRDKSSWSEAILDGLMSRDDLPSDERQRVIDDARRMAITTLARGGS